MGVKVKHWKGAYWVFINHHRRRKAKRVGEGEKAKRAADRAADIIRGQLAAGNASAFEEARDRPATLAEFAETWLTATVALQCKPATQENYRVAMRRHWLPALGALSLPAITRERIKAVESRPIDPFTPAELTTLLTTAEQHMPEHYPLILTLARTGIRIGEALALRLDDLDFHQGNLWVRRTWGRRTLGTPKTGKARRVDMSRQLAEILHAHVTVREAEAVLAGRPDSQWLFPDPHAGDDALPMRPVWFYKGVWWSLLRRSGLRYRNPHTLRHTFASQLLQNRESVTYVRDQLGHSSIRMTVDIYGHLVPGANRQAVDRLDDATGRNLYATGGGGVEAEPQESGGVKPRREYLPRKYRSGSRPASSRQSAAST